MEPQLVVFFHVASNLYPPASTFVSSYANQLAIALLLTLDHGINILTELLLHIFSFFSYIFFFSSNYFNDNMLQNSKSGVHKENLT